MDNLIKNLKDETVIHMNDTKEGVLMMKTPHFEWRDKLAMFDLDDTLIYNKSRKRFFVNKDDWAFYSTAKKTLRGFHKEGYTLIIITNQTGLKNNPERCEMFVERLRNVMNSLNLPILLLAATYTNIYKKPSPTFYSDVILKCVKPKNVFYCGDAAGREDDFSNSDYQFAVNCLIKFHVREGIFHKSDDRQAWDFEYPKIAPRTLNFGDDSTEFKYKKMYDKELILMMGFPASGKSTIRRILTEYHGFRVASKDEQKSRFNKILKGYIEDGENIVVDNTNLSKKSRKVIIDMVEGEGYKIRCMVMGTSLEDCFHNNYYRAYTTDRELINPRVYMFMKNNWEYPEKDEGIDNIEDIEHNFVNTFEYAFYYPKMR